MKKKIYTSALLLSIALFGGKLYAQSDITDSPGIVSAQYNDSPAGEEIGKVTDNLTSTKFLTFHTSGWIQFKPDSPKVVKGYALTSANDEDERDPKNFTLTASNDGVSWITLDNQNDQNFVNRFERKTYAISNNKAYAYYRIFMNNHNGSILQLAEWELFGESSAGNIMLKGGNLTTQYFDAPRNENIFNLNDTTATTKFLTFHNAVWVKLQQINTSVVTKYAITSANDISERDPSNWTLEASNDGNNWSTLDSRTNQIFTERLQRREFVISNTSSYKYYRLNLSNSDNTLQFAEWELIGTGGGGDVVITPPTSFVKTFDENKLVNLSFYDNDVAIYLDPNVNTSTTWLNKYVGDVWRYSKQLYGDMNMGDGDKRLYVYMHQSNNLSANALYYFEAGTFYRNSYNINSPDWSVKTGWNLDATTHEIGHMIESTAGAQESPAYGDNIWGDSQWCPIFQYDIYKALGLQAEATRWYSEQMLNKSDQPRANTYWFKNWFYPIYNTYGEGQVLSKYFKLLSAHYPKNGRTYTRRNMNWGEFVHFWSGAAGVNLKAQATLAFGWSAEWEAQFNIARAEFPKVVYAGSNSLRMDTESTNAPVVSVLSNELTVTLPDYLNGSNVNVALYNSVGKVISENEVKIIENTASVSRENLTSGIYVIHVNTNGETFKQKFLIHE